MGSKLIRDKVPEIMLKNTGASPKTHVADEEEYFTKLKEKLKEEVAEFSTDQNVEELADILEVVYAISQFMGTQKDQLEKMREEKSTKRGSFKERIILDEISGK